MGEQRDVEARVAQARATYEAMAELARVALEAALGGLGGLGTQWRWHGWQQGPPAEEVSAVDEERERRLRAAQGRPLGPT